MLQMWQTAGFRQYVKTRLTCAKRVSGMYLAFPVDAGKSKILGFRT